MAFGEPIKWRPFLAVLVGPYKYWHLGRQLDIENLDRIPWARKPGLDLTGKGSFSQKARKFFGLDEPGLAAHHLLVQQLENKFPKMFEPQRLIRDGKVVYLPGPSIAMHHPLNTSLLSTTNGKYLDKMTST